MGGGEVGEGVAKGPAFVEGGFEGVDFVVGVWVGSWETVVCIVILRSFVGFGNVCIAVNKGVKVEMGLTYCPSYLR